MLDLRFKGKLKVIGTGVLGVGAAAGLTAGLVACGSDFSFTKGTYYSTIEKGTYSDTKSDSNLIVWIPWAEANPYSVGAKKMVLKSFGITNAAALATGNNSITIPAGQELAGRTLDFRFTDSKLSNAVSINGTGILESYLSGRETAVLPDIFISYPDVAAVFAKVGLLHDLGSGAADLVADGFKSDVASVIYADGVQRNTVLPFSKTSDAMGVDIVVMAKVMADTAAAGAVASPAITSVQVPANSAFDRIFRMITATSTVSNGTVTLNMNDIYEPHTGPKVSNGVATYQLSEFTTAWNDKTKTGGIWERDKPVVEGNFPFKNTTAARNSLTSVDYSKEILNSFNGLSDFGKSIMAAYDVKKGSSATNSSYVYGLDSVANNIYSYQYDVAGHSRDNFFMNTKPVTVDGQSKSGVIRYELYGENTSATFVESANWLSNSIRSGAGYIATTSSGKKSYSSSLFKEHQLIFSIGSTNGLNNYADSARTVNVNEKVNIGEVYYDLQPSKAYATETKNSILNQGPSMFMTNIHGIDVANKVATSLLRGYETGAEVSGNTDTGYWSTSGYIYGNKASYKNANGTDSDYVTLLRNLTKDPKNWPFNIGKRLLVDYLDKVTPTSNYELYTNPVAANTAAVRSKIDTLYDGPFTNFTVDRSQPLPTGDEVAAAVVRAGLLDGWLKKAE